MRLFILPVFLSAQGTRADYDRSTKLRDQWRPLIVNQPERPTWIEKTHKFWYRKAVGEGGEYVLIDADAASKAPAFDHDKLAAALAEALKDKIDPKRILLQRLEFVDETKAITFEMRDFKWKFILATGALEKTGPVERREGQGNWQDFGGPAEPAASVGAKASPDAKWEAFVRNFNVYVRSKDDQKKEEFALTYDGAEGNYYSFRSIAWSPDSKKLVAYRVRRGLHRRIQYVRSSPAGQLQPEYSSIGYTKPGDVIDFNQPVLLLLDDRKSIEINNALFASQFELSDPEWRKDSRAFTFEYNQRGHQVYRIIEVEAATGKPRAVISEEPKTFFTYSGKMYRSDLADGKEIVWMSERDGWNHLYLYDGATGRVKNQITKGAWVVRGVDKVDEEARKIWFRASGMNSGQDPYFIHCYTINFDGTGLTALTEENATHSAALSSDRMYYTDLYSRVDLPPVLDVRKSADRSLVLRAEQTDISALVKAGWKSPEVFTAKARDGKTDIWGVIFRPLDLQPE